VLSNHYQKILDSNLNSATISFSEVTTHHYEIGDEQMSRPSTVEKFVTEVVTGIKAGKSAAEVAKALGIKASSLSSQASALRSKGVKLPSFTKGRKPSSVSSLNKLIKSL
jgi:biotin operon repressor